jgi:predicted Zn-dependent peptidase
VRDKSIHQTAHIMEHMSFGPNAEYSTMEAFSQEFSRNGAYSNASTFDTNMHYYADCAQFEWERILKLQQLAITQPKFLPEILEAEKGNVREELTGQLHNNTRQLWMQMNRAMGGHSLIDEEKIATIDAVSVEDIREHYARTHTHKNMRFVLAGNFDGQTDRVVELLEGWNLEDGERLEPILDTIHASDPVSLQRKDQENSTFAFTMVIDRRLETSELVAFSALNHLLTGTFHSRIFGKARTRGICYGVGSSTTSDLNGTSSWDFHGQVRPDNATALYELIRDELRRIADGDISDADLEDAKQYLTGDYQMRGQTVGALAGWYAGDYFFDETIDGIDNASEHIAKITKDDMVKLAREFIAARTWTLGEVGNVEADDTNRHYDLLAKLFK